MVNFYNKFKVNIFTFSKDLLVLKSVFLVLITFSVFISLVYKIKPLSLRHIGLYLIVVVVMLGIIYPRKVITILLVFISFIEMNKIKAQKTYEILLGFTLFGLCIFFSFTININSIYVDKHQILFFDSRLYYEFTYGFQILIISITLLNIEIFNNLSVKGKVLFITQVAFFLALLATFDLITLPEIFRYVEILFTYHPDYFWSIPYKIFL